MRATGIAYADETLGDRDQNGVLWQRCPSRPGLGRPIFGAIHPLRQRRAMRRLLCSICGGPPDRTDLGVLWVLRDFRDDWPDWPEGMGAVEPPVCLPCARLSIRLCPALRGGPVFIRVKHSRVAGVYGICYRANDEVACTVAFTKPAIRYTQAAQLVRELHDCTLVDVTP